MADDTTPSQHAQEHMEGESNARTDLLERHEGFGKYEGELKLTEVLDGLFEDESTGSVDAGGHYRVHYFTESEVGGPTAPYVAAILKTDSQGFVTAEYYESYEETARVWERVLAATASDDGEE